MGRMKENSRYNVISCLRISDEERKSLDKIMEQSRKCVSDIMREAIKHFSDRMAT